MGKKIIISIEGNIGSGKTTQLDLLKDIYKNDKKIIFIDEPLDEWQNVKGDDGINILQNFYENPKKYACLFQILAFNTRFSQYMTALLNMDATVIIMERSVDADMKVFANMQSENMTSIQYEVYKKIYDMWSPFISKVNHIYLRTEPSTAFNRMMERNRSEEKISLEFIQQCHNYHDAWLCENDDGTSIVINSGICKEELFQKVRIEIERMIHKN